MNSGYVIVWDLDDTIGDFSALSNQNDRPTEVTVTTRPGLRAVLESLCHAGFVHTVLTMASSDYAETALRGTGLRDLFVRVEGRGQRDKGDVAGIAATLGIAAADIPSRFLFIGDRMTFDEPAHRDVVFHLEPAALIRPAIQFQQLALRLRELGNGSIRAGFRVMGSGKRQWYPPWRRTPMTPGDPRQLDIDQVGPMVLLERHQECPIIGFTDTPKVEVPADHHSFIPADLSPDG